MNDYLITLDIDWASDEIIEQCAGILRDRNVKATWLVTHDSGKIRELGESPDLFELGVHPNFHPGSTQGGNPGAVLEHLLDIVPGARSVRTHGLFQSTELLHAMCADYGLEHDLSLLLPDAPHITPHEFHLPRGLMKRFPTFWEDDVEMLKPEPSFVLSDPKFHVPGLKIFSFHPIHVALNSRSVAPYEQLKSERPVATLSLDDLRPFVNEDAPGAATLFRELVDLIADGGTNRTVSELADEWMTSR